MNKKTIDDVNVCGKRVFVRCDFNVPLDENQQITDDERIVASLPTIKKLIKDGAILILASHLGRPKGERKPKYSLKPVAERLKKLLEKEIKMMDDCIGDEVEKAKLSAISGDVILLENLRFYKEEEKNEPEFAKKLAKNIDIYVNDAFGTAHRAHASTEGITKYVPVAAAGYLLEKEIRFLYNAVNNPERPFVAVLGGAKVADKIGVIKNLLTKVNTIIIGGGMAYTFFKAQGYEIGKSLLDAENIEFAKEMIVEAKKRGVKLLLPVDTVVADKFPIGLPEGEKYAFKTVDSDKIPADMQGLDIGEKTRQLFAEELSKAKTVVWNGPMGVFEVDDFAKGTLAIAEALAKIKGTTIIGGGDSVAAVKKLGLSNKMTHISTGGGASLEFLEGIELPGVVALNDKSSGCCCCCS